MNKEKFITIIEGAKAQRSRGANSTTFDNSLNLRVSQNRITQEEEECEGEQTYADRRRISGAEPRVGTSFNEDLKEDATFSKKPLRQTETSAQYVDTHLDTTKKVTISDLRKALALKIEKEWAANPTGAEKVRGIMNYVEDSYVGWFLDNIMLLSSFQLTCMYDCIKRKDWESLDNICRFVKIDPTYVPTKYSQARLDSIEVSSQIKPPRDEPKVDQSVKIGQPTLMSSSRPRTLTPIPPVGTWFPMLQAYAISNVPIIVEWTVPFPFLDPVNWVAILTFYNPPASPPPPVVAFFIEDIVGGPTVITPIQANILRRPTCLTISGTWILDERTVMEISLGPDSAPADSFWEITFFMQVVTTPTDVRVVNEEPVWTSPIKPDTEDSAVMVYMYVSSVGQPHQLLWTAKTQNGATELTASSTTKKGAKDALLGQVRQLYPSRLVIVSGTTDGYALYQQNIRNRLMHSLNGNTHGKPFDPSQFDGCFIPKGNTINDVAILELDMPDMPVFSTPPPSKPQDKVEEAIASLGILDKLANFSSPKSTIEVTQTIDKAAKKAKMTPKHFLELISAFRDNQEAYHIYQAGLLLLYPLWHYQSGYYSNTKWYECFDEILMAYETELMKSKMWEDSEEINSDKYIIVPEVVNRNKGNMSPKLNKKKNDLETKIEDKKNIGPLNGIEKEMNIKVPSAKSVEQLRQNRTNALQRIASKLHAQDISLVVWADKAQIPRRIKREIFNLVRDRLYKENKVIAGAADLLLDGAPPELLIDVAYMDKGLVASIPKVDIEPMFPTSYSGIRKVEAERHNKLMHAIDGNTQSMEVVDKSKGFMELITDGSGTHEFLGSTIINQMLHTAGYEALPLDTFVSAFILQGNPISNVNGAVGPRFAAVNISVMMPTRWMQGVGGVTNGPLKTTTASIQPVAYKIRGEAKLTPTGTYLLTELVRSNVLSQRADHVLASGFSLQEAIYLVNMKPIVPLCLDELMIKFSLIHHVLSFQNYAVRPSYPATWQNPYDRTQRPPNALPSLITQQVNVHPSAQCNPVDAAGVFFFPYTAQDPGAVYFHTTIQTVPINARADAIYFPVILATGPEVQTQLAIFIALWARYPSHFTWNTYQAEDVANNNNYVQWSFPFSVGVNIPGRTILHIVLPRVGQRLPPQAQNQANADAQMQPQNGPSPGGVGIVANAQININYIGAAGLISVNLAGYLASWFTYGPGSITIQHMAFFLKQFAQVCGVLPSLKRVEDLVDTVANGMPSMILDTPGAGVFNAPVAPQNVTWYLTYSADFRLKHAQLFTGPPPPLYQIVTPPYEAWIGQTDNLAFNQTAFDLYLSPEVDDVTMKYPEWIGRYEHNIWSAARACVLTAVQQVFHQTIGLPASQWDNLLNVQSPTAYREFKRGMFGINYKASHEIMQTKYSNTQFYLFQACTTFKMYRYEGTTGPICIYDRRMLLNNDISPFVPSATAVDTEYQPALMSNVVMNRLLPNIPKWMRMYPLPVGVDAVKGYSDGMADIRPAGNFAPFISKDLIKGLDQDKVRVLWNDESLWNIRLALNTNAIAATVDIWGFNVAAQVPANNTLKPRDRLNNAVVTIGLVIPPDPVYLTCDTAFPFILQDGRYVMYVKGAPNANADRSFFVRRAMFSFWTWQMPFAEYNMTMLTIPSSGITDPFSKFYPALKEAKEAPKDPKAPAVEGQNPQ